MTNREIDKLFTNMAQALREMYVREATDEEMCDYERVEAITLDMDEDEFDRFIEAINGYAMYINEKYDGVTRKGAYSRAYRMAHKYGLTVKQCVNWTFID